eukprot:m.15908 g.15908  ORF g.15908 m.15908 type:complete len:120 (+) comp26620_c0_seq2:581-940(+)
MQLHHDRMKPYVARDPALTTQSADPAEDITDSGTDQVNDDWENSDSSDEFNGDGDERLIGSEEDNAEIEEEDGEHEPDGEQEPDMGRANAGEDQQVRRNPRRERHLPARYGDFVMEIGE